MKGCYRKPDLACFPPCALLSQALWGLIDTKSVETADSNLEDGMTARLYYYQ